VLALLSNGDVRGDGSDRENSVDEGGEELRRLNVVGNKVGQDAHGECLVDSCVPVDKKEGGGGVPVSVTGVAELPNHVDAAFEGVGFAIEDGGALDKEIAYSGEGVAAAKVARVAVGLFEPIGQVLTEAGQLRLGADEELRAAVPASDDHINLLLVGAAEYPGVDGRYGRQVL